MAGKVVLEVFRHIWLTLTGLQYPAALMGGLALGFWERYRATRDVDVLIGVDHGHVDRLFVNVDRSTEVARGICGDLAGSISR
jgi:hypothetical protein